MPAERRISGQVKDESTAASIKDSLLIFSFTGTSTMGSKDTIVWEDGKSCPLIKVEIS